MYLATPWDYSLTCKHRQFSDDFWAVHGFDSRHSGTYFRVEIWLKLMEVIDEPSTPSRTRITFELAALSLGSSPFSITMFSFSERLGMFFSVLGAWYVLSSLRSRLELHSKHNFLHSFSAVSVTPILLLAVVSYRLSVKPGFSDNFVQSKWLRRMARAWGGNSGVPDPIDNIIFLNLMVADLIRAVGL
jgi:hypothetical protein